MRHLQINVSGKVQGVYFRASAKAVADLLGIKGYVMNMPDGTVYMEAEGDEFAMEEFLEFCNKGPEHAVVEKVECHKGELKNYRNFEVTKKMPR